MKNNLLSPKIEFAIKILRVLHKRISDRLRVSHRRYLCGTGTKATYLQNRAQYDLLYDIGKVYEVLMLEKFHKIYPNRDICGRFISVK